MPVPSARETGRDRHSFEESAIPFGRIVKPVILVAALPFTLAAVTVLLILR